MISTEEIKTVIINLINDSYADQLVVFENCVSIENYDVDVSFSLEPICNVIYDGVSVLYENGERRQLDGTYIKIKAYKSDMNLDCVIDIGESDTVSNEDEDFEFWNSFNNWFLKQKGNL